MFASRADLEAFIRRLSVPEHRRAAIETELFDHLESRIEVELMCGASLQDAEASALQSLGEPKALRAALQQVEAAFDLTPRQGLQAGLQTVALVGTAVALFGTAIIEVRNPALALISVLCLPFVISIALARLAPPGMGATLRQLIRSRRPRRERTPLPHLQAAHLYLQCLLWGPPILSVLACALSGAALFFVMVPYFLLWLSFGAFGFGVRAVDWYRSEPRHGLESGDDH